MGVVEHERSLRGTRGAAFIKYFEAMKYAIKCRKYLSSDIDTHVANQSERTLYLRYFIMYGQYKILLYCPKITT
jgi:hypothetical protein